jgi:hypothetical protein
LFAPRGLSGIVAKIWASLSRREAADGVHP